MQENERKTYGCQLTCEVFNQTCWLRMHSLLTATVSVRRTALTHTITCNEFDSFLLLLVSEKPCQCLAHIHKKFLQARGACTCPPPLHFHSQFRDLKHWPAQASAPPPHADNTLTSEPTYLSKEYRKPQAFSSQDKDSCFCPFPFLLSRHSLEF